MRVLLCFSIKMGRGAIWALEDIFVLCLLACSLGCEYRFGLFPVGEGCQQSYNQCSFGLPTQVRGGGIAYYQCSFGLPTQVRGGGTTSVHSYYPSR